MADPTFKSRAIPRPLAKNNEIRYTNALYDMFNGQAAQAKLLMAIIKEEKQQNIVDQDRLRKQLHALREAIEGMESCLRTVLRQSDADPARL